MAFKPLPFIGCAELCEAQNLSLNQTFSGFQGQKKRGINHAFKVYL